eukprot:PITA_04000
MGCVYSKRFLRTTSFQENLKRPFPSVAATPILDDLVLANSHEFVALIRKANKLAMKLPTPSESENVLRFISKDPEGERLISGNHVRVNSDLQSESSSKEGKSETQEAGEEESEEHKLTEKDKRDSDSLSSNTTDVPEELTDKTVRERVSRSKCLESFHTVEEYDAFLARRKRLLWNRNSKRHLYYLGLEHIETINEFSSISISRLYSCPQLSLSERNMIPVVIDWEEELEDDNDCIFESAVLQPSFELSDMKSGVNNNREENNGVAQTVSESIGMAQTVSENSSREVNNDIVLTISKNSGCQENRQSVEITNIGNIDMAEENLENDPSKETHSVERTMQVRVKLNDPGGIVIPSTPDFSARVSLKEWLADGPHLYSPGISTGLSLVYSESGDKWSKVNDDGNSDQPSNDETKMETDDSFVLNVENAGESSVYFNSGVAGKENKQWEYSLFEPELLASFDKAIEQLSEEEQHLLRQIEEDSNLQCRESCTKDNGLYVYF